jgi:hypothetical protein
MVSRALACAPPLPIVTGEPLRSKPKKVIIKLHLGYLDVFVHGSLGEQAFYRLPLRAAAADPGCKGMLVVNFSTASVGLIDSIATVGPEKHLVLTTNILVRGSPMALELEMPVEAAISLVMASSESAAPASGCFG